MPSWKDVGFGLFIRDQGYMTDVGFWRCTSPPQAHLPIFSRELPDAPVRRRDSLYRWPLVPVSWHKSKMFAHLGAG